MSVSVGFKNRMIIWDVSQCRPANRSVLLVPLATISFQPTLSVSADGNEGGLRESLRGGLKEF